MKTFTQWVENMMPTRDPDYGLNVTADVAQDENDASVFVLPLLHKLRTFKDYLSVIAESLHTSLTRRDMDSQYPEIKVHARLMRILGIPFNVGNFSTFNQSIRNENSLLARDYVEDLRNIIEINYALMEHFVVNKVMIGAGDYRSKQEYVDEYIRRIDEALALPIENTKTLNPRTQAAIKRILNFLEKTKEPMKMIGHHFGRQKKKAFKQTLPKKSIQHTKIDSRDDIFL